MSFIYPKPTILVLSNNETITTFYGHYYAEKFVSYARSKGYHVIHLVNPILPDVQRAIFEYSPRLIIFFGLHGGELGVLGQDRHVIAGVKGYDDELSLEIVRENIHWFSGKIVILLSCYSGSILGKELVERGHAEAVIGWKSPFFFVSSTILSPEVDDKARPFFKSVLVCMNGLVDGLTVGESYHLMLRAFKKEAIKWLKIDQDIAKYLAFDRENAVMYGDFEARLI